MLVLYISLIISLLLGSLFFHVLPKIGKNGILISEFFCCAPGIDLALTYFMILPLALGIFFLGGKGLIIAFFGELTSLFIWIILHELSHYQNKGKGQIASTLSGIFGKWRNHLAVWITALAIPVFWAIRFAEIIVYPPLTWLIKLPKYEVKEWVNISRHKFEGLVGYDLIWCLYCDWMTGVWSLGSEMLRNVESFWCPIKFDCNKKCENCSQDFPDVVNSWVLADGNMEDVTNLLKDKYDNVNDSSWFGHSSRK